jgi:hypothetical protein
MLFAGRLVALAERNNSFENTGRSSTGSPVNKTYVSPILISPLQPTTNNGICMRPRVLFRRTIPVGSIILVMPPSRIFCTSHMNSDFPIVISLTSHPPCDLVFVPVLTPKHTKKQLVTSLYPWPRRFAEQFSTRQSCGVPMGGDSSLTYYPRNWLKQPDPQQTSHRIELSTRHR